MITHRRNCQAMAQEMDGVNDQRLHHLLTQAKWEASGVMDRITVDFYRHLQSYHPDEDIALLLDESSFPKKGNQSAGVNRQYCGQRGKIDNCQVGVFAALNGGSMVNLVQAALYQPDQNISKIDHARDIISHVTTDLQIPVQWVGFDAFYGRDTSFLSALAETGQEFIADVPGNIHVWLSCFEMEIPGKLPGKGRKPTRLKPTTASILIRDYCSSLRRKDWQKLTIRYQSKGKLKAKFHRKDVYVLNPLTSQAMKLILLVRKDKDGTIKYSLCHAPKYVRTRVLAYRQCKRYFIEQAFRDTKKELGLNEYQTRSEVGWLRHMALCMLAQLFINTEKLRQKVRHHLKLTTGEIVRCIKMKVLFPDSYSEKVFSIIRWKQPFRKSTLDNLFYLRM
nr:IS701 family transposase [Paraflavitalea speifideiaquila]